ATWPRGARQLARSRCGLRRPAAPSAAAPWPGVVPVGFWPDATWARSLGRTVPGGGLALVGDFVAGVVPVGFWPDATWACRSDGWFPGVGGFALVGGSVVGVVPVGFWPGCHLG